MNFFSSFGESKWLGAPEKCLSLGRGREDLLGLTASFVLSDVFFGMTGKFAASQRRGCFDGAVIKG